MISFLLRKFWKGELNADKWKKSRVYDTHPIRPKVIYAYAYCDVLLGELFFLSWIIYVPPWLAPSRFVNEISTNHVKYGHVILNLAFVCCFFCYITMDDSYMLLRDPKVLIITMSPFHLFILCTDVNGRALSLLLFQSGYTRTIEQHTDKTTFIIFLY